MTTSAPNKKETNDVVLYMSDLAKSWNEETIALLVNKKLVTTNNGESERRSLQEGEIRVTILLPLQEQPAATTGGTTTSRDGTVTTQSPDKQNCKKKKRLASSMSQAAKLELASRNEQRLLLACYQGIAIPHTHNYHYYQFHTSWPPTPISTAEESIVSSSNDSPDMLSIPASPLHLQLMAVPTTEIQRRCQDLVRQFNETSQQRLQQILKQHQKSKVWRHASLVQFLMQQQFPSKSRPIVQQLGLPVPLEWTQKLRDYLANIPAAEATCGNHTSTPTITWPPTLQQRKGVRSSHYLTVRQHHPPHHDELWALCRHLLEATLGDKTTAAVNYNALAITKNFVGSPHVDRHDQTFQYVVAVGDFEGGELCCEYDRNGKRVAKIDIHNRIGHMDGRHVHWVHAWQGRERYSVVYYSTNRDHHTEPMPQQAHVEWMQEALQSLHQQ